jgi:hypothetical protein
MGHHRRHARSDKVAVLAAALAVTTAIGVLAALGVASPVSAADGRRLSNTARTPDASPGTSTDSTAGDTSYAQLSRRPAARGRTVHYAVPRHLCGQPTIGQMTCDAVKLVPATKTTNGAKAYVAPATTRGPAGGYTPADLASAYGYDPATTVHQTVAIIDGYDDPHALADLNKFDSHYGLPAETSKSFRKVNQNGKASPLPTVNKGWSGEIALDIEAVRAVCHSCHILLVEANRASAADLAVAVDSAVRLGATEVSNSYGGPESAKEPASIAKAYNHPGVVITAATGDDGWYSWDLANDGSNGASANAPNSPAAYPSVVAVGGTALSLNTDGTRQQEAVWNEDGPDDSKGLIKGVFQGDQGASGGGCSHIYAAPAWQAGVAGYAKTGCGTKRLAADVSALADPYTGFDIYDSYASGWITVGGTSLASPLVASMWALAGGAHGVAYPAQTLYDNLEYRSSSIFDVTNGGNSFCGGDTQANCSAVVDSATNHGTGNPNNLGNHNPFYSGGWAGLLDCGFAYDGSETIKTKITQCYAATGYDGAGVGAPQGLTLFSPTRPTFDIQNPSVLKLGASGAWAAIRFADGLGGTATDYRWSWGDGTSATDTTSSSTTHAFTVPGTHQVTLTVTDNLGQKGTAKRSVTVGVKPTAVIGGKTRLTRGTPATWTSAKSSETNTGGRIVSRTWELDGKTVGTGGTWAHRFTTAGRYKLTLVVVDNTGLRGRTTVSLTVTR